VASLADYSNDPKAIAYLKEAYARSLAAPAQGVANSATVSTDQVAPFDAALTQANDAADLGYGNSLAVIDQAPGALRRQYGYTDTGDIDPNNPFGKAQLLQRSYDQAQKGNTNSYAARGQLYSGALQRRKNEDQFNYQANDALMRGQYGSDMANVAGQRAAATNAWTSARSNNFWNWAQGQTDKRNAQAAAPAAPAASPAALAGPASTVSDTQPYGSPGSGVADSSDKLRTALGEGPRPGGTYGGTLVGQAIGNDPAVAAYLKALAAAQSAGKGVGAGVAAALGGRR
jgi:hypothetical protein